MPTLYSAQNILHKALILRASLSTPGPEGECFGNDSRQRGSAFGEDFNQDIDL
jgi:hypothetical protein